MCAVGCAASTDMAATAGARRRIRRQSMSSDSAAEARLAAEILDLRRRLAAVDEIVAAHGSTAVIVAEGRVLATTRQRSARFVEINVGTQNGVRVGQAVVRGWRLLGLIAGANPQTALVRLISDRDSRVPVRVLSPAPAAEPASLQPIRGVCCR